MVTSPVATAVTTTLFSPSFRVTNAAGSALHVMVSLASSPVFSAERVSFSSTNSVFASLLALILSEASCPHTLPPSPRRTVTQKSNRVITFPFMVFSNYVHDKDLQNTCYNMIFRSFFTRNTENLYRR